MSSPNHSKRKVSSLRNMTELLLGGLIFPAYVLLSDGEIRGAQGVKFMLQIGGLWLLGILLAAVMRAWWWVRIGCRQAAHKEEPGA